MKRIAQTLLLLLPLALAACGTPGPVRGPQAGAQTPGQPAEAGARGGAQGGQAAGGEAQVGVLPEEQGFQGNPLEDPHSLLSKRVIYFDFDSAAIKDEYKPIIEAHAAYLAQRPQVHVILEGHTDERGTREYNLALGERRAESVRKMLLLLGVSPEQVTTISYGEERPADPGHDEAAWAKNRRVVIVYPGQG
ncbi:MAG: peptidoglycan-associated lipoprotein Pal [Gammaproteobacteria bacterium]|nr:MAG: peptidoglycan-associated lipoprotein Pal [Gammaproteobacteria bacterium]